MTALHAHPLFSRLDSARSVLVAGAGGGFDIYAGLPLESWVAPDLAVITPDTAPHQPYFPERALARWLTQHGYPGTVHALSRVGVQPLRAAYRAR